MPKYVTKLSLSLEIILLLIVLAGILACIYCRIPQSILPDAKPTATYNGGID